MNGNHDGNRNANRGSFRGGRQSGAREGGGFRIRLSDNEMRASRSIQEAFNLRSTVAVLGFAVRTLGDLLEQGKLEEVLKTYKDDNKNNFTTQKNGRQGSRSGFNQNSSHFDATDVKPNPFARPEKPKINSAELEDDIKEENETKNNSDIAQNPIEESQEINQDVSEEAPTNDISETQSGT